MNGGLARELQAQTTHLSGQIQPKAQVSLERALKAQRKTGTAQTHAQALAALFDLVFQPRLVQVLQHAPEGGLGQIAVIHRGQVVQARCIPFAGQHRLQVMQHVIAHPQDGRQIEQLVERLAQHRQRLVLTQFAGRLGQAQGHIGQLAAKIETDGGVEFAQTETGGACLQVHADRLPAQADALRDTRTRAVEVQAKLSKGLDACGTGQGQHGCGVHAQGKTRRLEHHDHAAIAHACLLGIQVDQGIDVETRQHQGVLRQTQLEIALSIKQWRRIRMGFAQGQLQAGCRLQTIALAAEREQVFAVDCDGCEALASAIAIDVALAEIHGATGQRALAKALAEAQPHAAGRQTQVRNAVQGHAVGCGLQTNEATTALCVFEQHQTQSATFELDAHKLIGQIDVQARANVHVVGRNGGQCHGAAAFVIQVYAAGTGSAEGKGACQAQHTANLQRGIGHQRLELASRLAVVQLHRSAQPTRWHFDGRLGQIHDLHIGHTAQRTQRHIGLHLGFAGRQLEVGGQAQIFGFEVDGTGRRLQRQPTAPIARQRVLGAHQRHAQTQFVHRHALHAGLHRGSADQETADMHRALTHADRALLVHHREVAHCREQIAQRQIEVTTEHKQFTSDIELVRVAIAIAHSQRVQATPIHRGVRAGQGRVDLQQQVLTRNAQVISLGTQQCQAVDVRMQAQPAACVLESQHQRQVHALELKAQGIRSAAAGQARRHVAAAHDQQVGIAELASVGQHNVALLFLELRAATETEHIAHARQHGATHAQHLALAAFHVQRQETVGTSTHGHR